MYSFMKRLSSVVTILITVALAGISQEGAENAQHLTFDVSTNKYEYLPLEPLAVRFTISNNTESPLLRDSPDFLKVQMESLDARGRKQGCPISFINIKQISFPRKFEPGDSLDDEILVVTSLACLFPTPGIYEVQFVLPASGANDVDLRSKPIKLEVRKPTGIDEEALLQLRKNQKSSTAPDELFRWKESAHNPDRNDALEDFVDRYQLSAYGDYAVLHLANFYLSRGQIDPAKNLLSRIISSKNEIVRKKANKNLDEIATTKIALEKENQQR
jgi:hypothetical protein